MPSVGPGELWLKKLTCDAKSLEGLNVYLSYAKSEHVGAWGAFSHLEQLKVDISPVPPHYTEDPFRHISKSMERLRELDLTCGSTIFITVTIQLINGMQLLS
jgi:hypothetical protein